MKILSLHVSSFGKLKNLKINLQSGVNVLKQNNGYGKTTLANFIRAMLYGFDYKRGKYGNATDAAFWATWNSTEKIGGSMEVEKDGVTYRVERYFGLTAKAETLSVVNVTTGKATNITNVGEFLLGLTAESYDRSAYFPQESVEISSNENFDNRLAGLVQNDVNYDAVMEKLRKYRKELKHERGEGGLISTLANEKFRLQRKLADCERDIRRDAEIGRRLEQIAAERESYKATAEQCDRDITHLQANVAQKQFADTPAKQKLAELQNKTSRYDNLEQDKATCDELVQKIEQIPVENKQSRLPLLLLIIGLVLVAAGIGVCFVILAAGISAIAVGAALVALGFFMRKPKLAQPSDDKDALLKQYYAIAGKYFYSKDMSFAEAQKTMWQTYNDYLDLKRERDNLLQTVRAEDTGAQDESKLQQLREKLAEIQRCQEALSREEGSLTAERKTLVCDTAVVREQIAEVEEKLREAQHNYEIAGKVAELLQQAKENLSVMYLPKLCERCKVLLNQITAGDYKPVIDRTFSIKLQTAGVTKSLDCFSRGIREITLLCFRVALSELLFGGNVPFLIIDDTFVNFDEENFLRATTLLKQLAKNTQILYFTCLNRLGALVTR